jgi:aldehyde dehydrogenase (NAD+)
MSAAVNHLTPVALELGGKCPAVVDSVSSSWDTKVGFYLKYVNASCCNEHG